MNDIYMASKYQEAQRKKQTELLKQKSPVFYGAKGGCNFRGKDRDFVMTDGKHNLYAPIQDAVVKYFEENRISWWGGGKPTGHVLSSQIACLNHLFAMRDDKEFVLRFLNGIRNEFVDVLPIAMDKVESYISFEIVSRHDHMNEGASSRGTQCTSIDAMIYAKHKSRQNWLIPIEWKYTEHYNNDNKAIGSKGVVRQGRYNDLIKNSSYLKSDDLSIYYYEPFYQLMRQTLWAEQMIKYKDDEILKADNFLHVHIIPSENGDLLQKKYRCSGLGMEVTWRNILKDQSKYIIVDPENILTGMAGNPEYLDLRNYLTTRYY